MFIHEKINEIENSNNENSNLNKNEKISSTIRNILYNKTDSFYRKAKEEGFRARSVYKLKEIHYNYNILNNCNNFLDLCAAPGSWSQMLRILTKDNKNSKIISVDIQDIVPIEGVTIIKGDITSQKTIEEIFKKSNNEKFDVIIFDGAPDVTGLIDIDLYMQIELIIFSLLICMKTLKEDGKFVAKVFKVKNYDERNVSVKSDFYYEKLKILFDNIFYFKPSSSRQSSHETYLIAEGFSIPEKFRNEFDSIPLDNIFDFEKKINNNEIKNFLRFLINGSYTI